MTLFIYPLTVEQDGKYLLGSLPDWPECHPVGDTIEAVHRDAINAIEEMASAYMEDGDDIPVATAYEKLKDATLVTLPLLTQLKLLLYQVMRRQRVSRAELARMLEVDPKMVTRLLDLNHHSRPDPLVDALLALGTKIEIKAELPERPQHTTRPSARAS